MRRRSEWTDGRRRLVVGLLAPFLALGATAAPDGPVFTIEDEEITEASGMSRSYRHQDTWWITNDSGDRSRVFAVDGNGRTRAEVTYNQSVRDVEALAVAPGPDRAGWVYVADIGDNLRRRSSLTVYRFAEPERLADSALTTVDPFPLEFEDGPHDAESLAIHPDTGVFVVVSKAGSGGIYATSGTPSVGVTSVLRRLGDAPILATDATFTADGSTLLVRTPVAVVGYRWPGLQQLGTVATPLRGPTGEALQGETVALGSSDTTVFVGSEGKRSPVYELVRPGAEGAPTVSASDLPEQKAMDDETVSRLVFAAPWVLGGLGLLVVGAVLLLVSRRRRGRHREG